ncbi:MULTISPECIES: YjhX family toxin [unclassified Mesorhizobium]|uniref:YjhX family toxin n=1 Tax=unclassified Mesorhizobium TaxID=325217 RepID=UPI000FCBB3E1|nr:MULTISPECIES: YjhX family toxin [unclassified Mesorhizobium]RUZ14968.1 hypothetical protein EN949_33170 [Mesorhizobium sp. M7A.F.Ca.US.007.01.2.1]RUZ92046.1 hypothetical protein EN947_02250 [Mesorhizobium sp. M7A.F.Ca.US.003.02.2.1]RUY92660.1 hypothetical protein EN974_26420 [Mesorhizobium sp. M7A.F.Ca.CA.001.12.2.1]RUZ44358.1 hypothetical protein EN948_23295 [Mesorhizobium sp. M7A.F.Ca.US.003.02.1.1]RUZ54495.1 hypothetical protein EN950_29270 [Mesorhizobium sp. M7A.F.Ca.US.007.01.1.1]
MRQIISATASFARPRGRAALWKQCILHLLAQGGRIEIEKNEKKRIASVKCLTRDGWHYPGVDLELFRKLKRKKAVSSSDGGPYRITRRGLALVRSELDNR